VADPPPQIRKRFHDELGEIDNRVRRLFALVSEGVAGATDAFLSGDRAAARELTERDALIDETEQGIEAVAERELLMEQPMARDMRYLLSVVRVVPELERAGDLAEHVAQRAATGLGVRLTPALRGLLEQMGAIAVSMWQGVSTAWAERDAGAAARLDELDDELDRLHERFTEELAEGGLTPPDAVQTTLVARFYERLGDHAVHIAERVRYIAGIT
jgi:phosphate transport system protein